MQESYHERTLVAFKSCQNMFILLFFISFFLSNEGYFLKLHSDEPLSSLPSNYRDVLVRLEKYLMALRFFGRFDKFEAINDN